MVTQLPKDIWSHIRGYSGPNDATPSAVIMRDLIFVIDTKGKFRFDFGSDGWASTVVKTRNGHFRRPETRCRNKNCFTCCMLDWSCIRSEHNVPVARDHLRFLHQTSDGDLIRGGLQ
jgi:hypothetical protein